MAQGPKRRPVVSPASVRNLRLLSIFGMMVLSFAVSYALMATRQTGGSVEVVPAMSVTALPSNLKVEPAVGPSVRLPAKIAAVPSAEHAASPGPVPSGQLPVAVQIRKWGGGFRYVGEIHNLSDKLLSVTMSVAGSTTGQTPQLQLDLSAGEKRGFASGAGFEFRSGDDLVLKSPEFADRFERVP